jgi:hypothetical protein
MPCYILMVIGTANDINAQNYVPEFNDARIKVKTATPIKAYSFNLNQVQLLKRAF